jgi:hypothetical protein
VKYKMSQQAAAGCSIGRGVGHNGKVKPRYFAQTEDLKGFKSRISKIAHNTFNLGQNKFVVQFPQL